MIVISVHSFQNVERLVPGVTSIYHLVATPCTPAEFFSQGTNDMIVNIEQRSFYSLAHVNEVIGVTTQLNYFTGSVGNNLIATLES